MGIMDRQTENRIVLVTRRTRFEELIAKFNTAAQAKFYIEHLGADFSEYETEHLHYQQELQATEAVLARQGKVSRIERAFLPNYLFRPDDTVVVLGQDGTVANTLKYLQGQPCIGVNPDPTRWDGVLLPFARQDLEALLPEVFANRARVQSVTFARARLNTGESILAVNDLFIGPMSHTSARYSLTHEDCTERQSSSGIIVSTGLGSTGWLRSILTGAQGILSNARKAPVDFAWEPLPWDHPELIFSVREPFPSRSSAATLVYGAIRPAAPLTLVSEMAQGGVIFSDGIEKDFLPFNNGTKATIEVVKDAGNLVVR
jgi:NAD kinase